ncbi:Magnesium/proton exchanger [Diplonema papillatum]|nr:Magnesium/proton exchanger [Diplonema papillatum]
MINRRRAGGRAPRKRLTQLNKKECTRYVQQASQRLSLVLVLLAIFSLLDAALAYDPAEVVAKNKEMNFKIHNETLANGTRVPNPLNYETGEVLDNTNPDYDERRWAFGWHVDMILRFEKGYSFCTAYILVPAENTWPEALRGLLYLVALFYLFLGVAIISDVFMAGIEVVTAEKEKIVVEKSHDGEKEKVIMYTVWNETVANLTLLALGSSAPEIMLSVLETCSNLGEVPGELGPSTIVGSAAFNLLCITGVCMYVLEFVKSIKEFGVFLITSAASLWAYAWLVVVLTFSSPDVVESWEAWITLLYFPLLVIVAYCQDRNWFRAESEPDIEDDTESGTPKISQMRRSTVGHKILEAQLVDCTREEVRDLVRQSKEQGLLSDDAIQSEFVKHHKPKLNRGHYRMNAIRNYVSKNKVITLMESGAKLSQKVAPSETQRKKLDIPENGIVEFASTAYSCLESEGDVVLKVKRHSGLTGRVVAQYKTQDLTAIDGVHYHSSAGTLAWEDGDTRDQTIRVKIIDNDVRNADMLFTCGLETDPPSSLGDVKIALITIVDDDLPGEIRFAQPSVQVAESAGTVRLKVVRENGSTGSLLVYFKTADGVGKNAAKDPDDYVGQSGHLHFDSGETVKTIDVKIVDDSQYEKEEHFFVILSSVEGKAGGKLGNLAKCRVDITSDTRMNTLVQQVLDRVMDNNVAEKITTSSWGKQFRDAMEVCGDGEEADASAYVMHFLTFNWKVLFALVPPTSIANGWACFFGALFFIGLVTAMVSEVASLFGCVVGLKDSVTAITFVALGTSLPDTFASKQAAENEEYADSAVGNVTGSNSVNVFLGLGLPWVMATIYYESKGECFIVPSGNLVFSVIVFFCTAIVCLMLLFILRVQQGGELGGPNRKIYAGFLFSLWIVYIVLSSLKNYDHFTFPGTERRCPCACKNRGILPWAALPLGNEGSCIDAGCPV